MSHHEIKYNDYIIRFIYGETTQKIRTEVVDLWRKNRVISDPREAVRRALEVACTIRNFSGQLVGLSTLYIDSFRSPQERVFYYRMFIQPSDRINGMMMRVGVFTFDSISSYQMDEKPSGAIMVAENLKVAKEGMIRSIERRGRFNFMGENKQGQGIFFWSFGK